MIPCEIASQEYKNGFCYDKCQEGYSGDNAGMCLEDCPPNFTDHGTTCEPPSVMRKTAKTVIAPCQNNQIDKNGNCFEPQVITTVKISGKMVPKVTGCGCNRKTLDQRIVCPSGYVVYNNDCVSECPPGYDDIKDKDGNIISLYCMAPCPFKSANSNTRRFIGGLCVKDYKTRTAHAPMPLGATPGNTIGPEVPMDGLPSTMASFLSSRVSSLNSRYRYGQSISDSLKSNPTTNPLAGLLGDLGPDLDKILYFIIIIFVLIYAGPSLLPLLGKGIGYIVSGVGLGVGSITSGVGNVVGSTLAVTADLERTSGLAAQRRGVEKLTQATLNLNQAQAASQALSQE